jgi:hypothetical protein
VNANAPANVDEVLNDRMGTDTDIVIDLVEFPDHDAMTGLKTVTNVITCVNDCMGADQSSRTNACLQSAWRMPTRHDS